LDKVLSKNWTKVIEFENEGENKNQQNKIVSKIHEKAIQNK
jgi:phosphoribosylformylglycinamidine (FGAM) synthase PurS component